MRLKIFITAMVSVIILIFGIMMFFFTTEQGTTLLMKRIIPLISKELSINRVSGTLSTSVALEGMQLSSKNILISVKKLSLQWDYKKLFKKHLYISKISINDVNITLFNKEKTAKTKNMNRIVLPEITMPFKLSVHHGELNNLIIKSENTTVTASSGTVSLTALNKECDIVCDVHLISIQKNKADTVYIHESSVHISGTSDKYTFDTSTYIESSVFPSSRLAITGQGSRTDIYINKFNAELLNGMIVSTGTCTWYPAITWHAKVEGKNLNPGTFWHDWPGNIAFNASITGSASDATRIAVEKTNFLGSLRGYPLKARTEFSMYDFNHFTTNTVIKTGSAIIALTGDMGDHVNVSWDINIPELKELLPESHGIIKSSGTIKGLRDNPVLHAHLMSTDVHYADITIKKLIIDSLADFSGTLPSIITIDSESLSIKNKEINTISIKASGIPEKHIISLNIQRIQDAFSMNLNGHFDDNKAWDGTIVSAGIESNKLGAWMLDDIAGLTIAKTHLSLKNIIFKQNEAHIAAFFNWKKYTGWDTRINVIKFPLTILNTYLPPKFNLEGSISCVIKSAGNNEIETLDAHISTPPDTSIRIAPLGLIIPNITINAESIGSENIALNGNAQLGNGILTFKGKTLLNSQKHYPSQLTVSGKNLQILDNYESKVYISPDILIEIKKDLLLLKGSVDIPEAKITIKEIPKGAVSASPEIVVIDESDTQQKGTLSTRDRYIKLTISLGDTMDFTGYGLSSQLAGLVSLEETPGKPLLALGELRIIQGTYKAYGQKLNISKGRLMFAGPMDNPGIDIKAERIIENITVGLLASGRLKSPEITIFSEPAMSNTDAFSYLLLGRPINQTSSKEGSYLMSAAAALQIKGGEFLSRQIGSRFGLEEVQIQTGGTKQNTQVMVGKSVTPKLYINYGITPFDFANIFRARYQINNKLSLLGESGHSSGIDLQYSLEYETSKEGPQHDINIFKK